MVRVSTDTEAVDLVGQEVTENVARAALFAALMGAFAYVSFPWPLSSVPVTLQVLGVFLAGIMLGPVWGGASMVLYLAAGAVGAPVFAGGSAGLGALFGPTGGYLLSYPVAALVIGAVVHGGADLRDLDDVGLARLVGGMALGTVVVYAVGVVGLWYVYNTTPDLPALSFWSAVQTGALVFLPAEALKAAAAVGIVRSEDIRAA